jgi:hypothetical protein
MNDIETTFLIFGILGIFISVPTFLICKCNCNKNKNKKISRKNYEEITDDKSDIIQV